MNCLVQYSSTVMVSYGDTSPREHATANGLRTGVCRFVCLVETIENSLRSISVAATRGTQRQTEGSERSEGWIWPRVL